MSSERDKTTVGTLRSLYELRGYRMEAKDAVLGRVDDCLFDDSQWAIRYLVANTSAIFGKQILLFTTTVGTPDWTAQTVPVALTKDQVKNSPPVDLDKPVSQQHVQELHRYYGWPMLSPIYPPVSPAPESHTGTGREVGDPHLRSVREVTGYGIQASDGEIGHVEDFVAEIEPWVIRYLVIDTRNWLPGRKVLISPAWVDGVNWPERKVRLEATREAVRNCPEFDPSAPINREYETRLHDYYGRPVYWR